MKHTAVYSTILVSAVAAAMFTACRGNICGPAEESYCGHIEIAGTLKSEVSDGTAKGTAEGFEIPSAEDFALTIEGGDGFYRKWESVAAFNAEYPYIPKGEYTVTINSGEVQNEGFGLPCFKGSAQAAVRPRKTESVTVTARIVNSLIVIECTGRFASYFPESEFTVTTAGGGCFTTQLPMQGPLFVSPDGSVEVVCTARKQTGEEVTFPAQTIDSPAPQTRYTLRYDVEQAGGTILKITLNDDVEEEIEIDAELNEYI